MEDLYITTHSDEFTSLMAQSAEIRTKLKAGTATQEDYIKLNKIEAGFTALKKTKHRLFCIKLKAQYLLFASKYNNEDILEEAHDLAVTLVAQSEMNKITAPSFYKILLKAKLELIRVKAVKGLAQESDELRGCAKRILKKATAKFPTYNDFLSFEFN